MNGLTVALIAIVFLVGPGCAVLDELERQAPTLDSAATSAMQTGGCLKVVCDLPLANCRVRPSRCHRN